MNPLTVPAHFDGERILLDAPVELERDTRLLVTILPKHDPERESWLQFSGRHLEAAYGEVEPEYGLDSIKESKPDYEGWRQGLGSEWSER